MTTIEAAMELAVPPVAVAVPTARHRVLAWLEAQGVAQAAREVAALVVSELVTNGVIQDGGDDIVIRARIEDEQIRFEVLTADDPSGPALNLRPQGETGRGIFIVASVTGGLEIEETGPGRRRVTCRVPLGG